MKHKVERSALVMHSAADMFALVNDVDRYKEFLPWCGDSKVVSVEGNVAIASVEIAFKGIKKSFTTKNVLTQDQKTDMSLVEGPFSELAGCWEFKAISADASRISLTLEFGFSNRVIEAVVGPVFRLIADSMVESFAKRADQIYP